jgi:hypothetical protein
MPFLRGYTDAVKVLTDIEKGKCDSACRKVWMPKIKKAVTQASNPLQLNKTQRTSLDKKLKSMKGKRYGKTLKSKPSK